jgi:hypothetical protein
MMTIPFSRIMRTIWALAIMATCLLLANAPLAFAKEKQLELKWSELGQVVVGRNVTIALPDGEIIEGKIQSIDLDSLIINIKKTTNKLKYAKGKCSIPRASISVLRTSEVQGMWRVLGTSIGAGTGAAVGSAFYRYANNESDTELGSRVAVGAIIVGAGLGYLAGHGIDHHVLIITVVY